MKEILITLEFKTGKNKKLVLLQKENKMTPEFTPLLLDYV